MIDEFGQEHTDDELSQIIEGKVTEERSMRREANFQLAVYVKGLYQHQQALIESGYKFPELNGKCPWCGGVVGETTVSMRHNLVYFYTCMNPDCTCELYATHRYEYVSFEKL